MNHIVENNFEERKLVERILEGDNTSFSAIIRMTERLVAQIIFKMIDHPEDRKDIAQDVYLNAYKNLSRFRFESKLSTWIAQISYNTCYNFLEKKKLVLAGDFLDNHGSDEDHYFTSRSQWHDENGHDPARKIIEQNRQTIIVSALEKLSPVYRTMISLYHQEEMSYEEIASVTSLPIGTVKSYLFRARKSLKDSLENHYKKDEL
ncbi:MAG: RNA polymerase subunit sigma-24 [Bacteroidetes bacterium]|nr:MAG: RNA polymerase subunit sigma-24 [Bacteroidota bacterium]